MTEADKDPQFVIIQNLTKGQVFVSCLKLQLGRAPGWFIMLVTGHHFNIKYTHKFLGHNDIIKAWLTHQVQYATTYQKTCS